VRTISCGYRRPRNSSPPTEALDRQQTVSGDPEESIRLHGDFHMLMVRLAGNQTLMLLNEIAA